MNCSKTTNLMSDYVDDCLDGHIVREFEEHIGGCRECSAELDAMKSLVGELASLGDRKCPVDCWADVRGRVRQVRPRPVWRTYLLRPAAAIPVLAAILMLGVFLVRPTPVEKPVAVSSAISAPEFSRYMSAHSRLKSRGAFSDPDVTFISAELETAEMAGLRDR